MTTPKTMGAFIRKLRKQRRITATTCAVAAGVSQPHFSRIENGIAIPSEASLEGIAGLLGVETRTLIRLYPRDQKTGFERGHLDDAADHQAAGELAKIYRCGKCGTRPSREAARTLVDALAELRAMSAAARGVRRDPELLSELWEDAQRRLDLIAALVDVA